MQLLDKLTSPSQVVEENYTKYYSDIYSPGDTKQQLTIGQEVQAPKSVTGTIDTATSLTAVNNSFILNVPNPDGKIFSMQINGLQKTFKIGPFANTALAYSTLVTELQNWLGIDYTVAYISGTQISIKKYDGSVITYNSPNLVRQITLTGFDSISKITVIVDGVSVILDGATHSGNPNTALTYLQSQLSSSIYYIDVQSPNFIIARKDGAIPTISQTQYNVYTYIVSGYSNSINPTSQNVGGINGTDEIKEYRINVGIDGNNTSYTLSSGLTFTQTSITIPLSNCPGTSSISPDNNGNNHGTKAIDMLYGLIGSGYTKGSMTSFSTSGFDYLGFTFPLNKNDYSSISIIESIEFVKDTTLALHTINNVGLGSIQTNHLASITTTTYTEIIITLSLSGNDYYISVGFNPKNITLNAKSSVGESTGQWEGGAMRGKQSCNAKYSTTTELVNDKIFKTNSSNFGNIVEITRAGFYINFTTNTSNKLTYTCTS